MRFFNATGIAETCSTASLYFIAMPLKYIGDNEILVQVIGPIHGILWSLYIGLLGLGWPVSYTHLTLPTTPYV